MSYTRRHLASQCCSQNVNWCQNACITNTGSQEVTFMALHTTLSPFYFTLICLIIPESSGLQYTQHTAHSCSKHFDLLNVKISAHFGSSRIIWFLKTLLVHAWACICRRWRDTSVGKMCQWDAHYE